MKSFLNRKFPRLAKNMEPKVMKSFLCRKFSGLAKRLSFFQQEERTSDDIDYKEIDAAEFQKICTMIDPTEEEIKKQSDPYAYLNHPGGLVPSSIPLHMPPNRFAYADSYIKNSGLEEHIRMDSFPDPLNKPVTRRIYFNNLKIKGDIEVVFSTLDRIIFRNSEFSDNVSITTLGSAIGECSAIVSFTENKFSGDFSLTVANPHRIDIEHNEIPNRMDMYYTFSLSSLNDHDSSNYTKTRNGTLRNKWLMSFLGNKISHLNIKDSEALDGQKRDHDNSLERITFDDNNHIVILTINTKHTVLATYAQLKTDIHKISFSTSDKIGFSPMNIEQLSYDLLDEQLTYGQFFSLLEAQASERHDRINEEKYKKKARYFYRNFLPYRKDRFIFGWTNLISKDGTSWIHPIFWLIGTEALLTGIAYYFLFGWDSTYFMAEGWQILLTLFSWFMNPASLLPLPTLPFDKEMFAKAWLIYPLFLFQKLFAAVFYYEAVKTLRRFTR